MNEKKGEVRDYDTRIIIMVSCETINRNGQSSYDSERNTFKEMNSTLPLSYLTSMLAEPSDKNPNRKHKLCKSYQ